MAVTMTATFPRTGTVTVRVAAADGTWTTLVSLTRSDPWGNTFDIRAAAGASLASGVAFVDDNECPLGVDVTYKATVSKTVAGVLSTDTGTKVISIPTDVDYRTFLGSALDPAHAFQPWVESIESMARETNVKVFEVLGRSTPVITTGSLGSRTGVMNLVTMSQDETDRFWNLVRETSVLLLRTTRTYGVGVLYFVPTNITETRYTRLGRFAQRRFAVEFIETDPPVGAALPYNWNTWDSLVDAGPSTWNGLIAARATWEQVLLTPFVITPPPSGG